MRSFIQQKRRVAATLREENLAKAREDFRSICDMIIRDFKPDRIYQWVLGKTADSVLIPVQILENAYTAVETLFLRIFQAFENHLESQRGHADLLEKMTLEVPGNRP